MAEQSYQIEVKPDFIERQSRASVETALSELIWNSLDADASNVNVEVKTNILGHQTALVVSDDGQGIIHSEAPALFRNLGGSWKNAANRTKLKNRELHGKEGRGRFRALSIGAHICWDVVYSEDKLIKRYQIYLTEGRPDMVRITDPVPAPDMQTGVTVTISDLKKSLSVLQEAWLLEYLSHTFAVYLMAYHDAAVYIEGEQIDPAHAISGSTRYELAKIEIGEESYDCTLQVIEWNTKTKRSLFLATSKGFPVYQVEAKLHAEGENFSSYLLSDYFPKIVDSGDVVAPSDRPEVRGIIEEARQQIKSHFRVKLAGEGHSIISAWKAEKVYPFAGDPVDSVDRAERQIFETVAVAVSSAVPDFEETPKAQKALNLRLLKHAIEKGPSDLQLILSEVLKLPKKKLSELAELLSHSELSNIVSAAAVVGDRLRFLTALRAILMNPELKKVIKERAQLHKILENNTWVFGERYNLWASDKELTNVLREVGKRLGDNLVVDEKVVIVDKDRGIVDLVVGRTNKAGAADEYDNLVIELKSPRTKLNSDHVVQIEKYASAVSRDQRFHRIAGLRWTFWLIADEYDDYVQSRIEGGANPRLRLITDDGKVRIGIKTWGEVLDDNFARLHFVQDSLKYDATEQESLIKLQTDYSSLFKGMVIHSDLIEEQPSKPSFPLLAGPNAS